MMSITDQFNTMMRKKWRDPAIVIDDPLIGFIVKDGHWKYVSQRLTEAFRVSTAWNKRKRPANEELPKTSMLNICTQFLTSLDIIKEHGATKADVQSGINFLTKNA